MIYIIAAILIFGVLIAVHELGHFLAAKACGVRVNEFAIGMGPALLKKTKGDTQYSLRLLPIGGFCAVEGEEEDSSDPAALNNQGFWQKLLIFAAGALMNFLAGLIIILVLYAGVKAVNVPVIRGFAEGCPLESASGLQVGDRILSIDGERIYTFSDVSLLLGRNKTGDFDLVLRRDGQKLRLENFHMERGEYLDQSGEKFTGFGLYFGAEELTFGGRLKYCWNQAVDFVRLVRLSLQMLITGEADAVTKEPGDHLLSGSFVISGKCRARMDQVGADSYASKLTLAAKKDDGPGKSEMMRSLDSLIRFIGIVLIPIGAALFYNQFINQLKQRFQFHIIGCQYFCCYTGSFLEQPRQNMFGSDIVAAGRTGKAVRIIQSFFRLICIWNQNLYLLLQFYKSINSISSSVSFWVVFFFLPSMELRTSSASSFCSMISSSSASR